MLKLVLFGALLAIASCGLFRLPHDISLHEKFSQFSPADTLPAQVVKEWLLDEIRHRDPDIGRHKEMIEHFFTASLGTGNLSISALPTKI